ncbi:hypothetical protein GCM10009678_43780 [Actinomadura kijaniata]|uniref:Putative enzyme related to lactoylglutathione lyase n=1 Tax=Actinomadura namibiensis TaxID=182080 RepID=A0A7W3LR77_ACTNM|nr:VOC family protein [Actinomadura namibiensis]MBA8952789.1 putative enzyme related to lactoylglutathione lyase [Actinomadura namibiensis]
MAIHRMDDVLIVVDDLEAVIAFFVMFAVDDIEDVVARLRAHGAELVGEVVRYEDVYRLCYVRGPEGIVVGLAEELG